MVTIVDVAKHAGVAPSTVSYVLTGKRPVSARTRVRVRESIQLLGYRPHAGGRGPAAGRADVLALALPLREGVHLPVVMRFVTSVVTAARAHDMDVLLVTADQGAAGLRRVAGGAGVGGFLVMDVGLDDDRVPVLRELGRPAVLLNEAVLGWVVERLRAEGRRVPEDVAVVAICPDELAERLRLTSVQLPAEVLGRQAVELLMAKLNGEQPPPLTLLPPELSSRTGANNVVGDSFAANVVE